MPGSLNDILPDPISAANERILLELLKRKMKTAAAVGVQLLHAMEERFGPAAREVIRDIVQKQQPSPRPDVGDPASDLQAFCANLEQGCAGRIAGSGFSTNLTASGITSPAVCGPRSTGSLGSPSWVRSSAPVTSLR
jgi:hypothetical protein